MRIGPLRKVVSVTRHSTDLYDRDSVVLSCGHTSHTNGLSARCSECALTDQKWRTATLPKIRLRLAELDGLISQLSDYHSTNGHTCKRCREREQLRRILEGKVN